MTALIRFQCPDCGKRYVAPATTAGRKGNCKKCGKPLVVPEVHPSSLPAEPSEPVPPHSFEHATLEECYHVIVKRFADQLAGHTVRDGRPRFRFVIPEDRKQEIELLVESEKPDREWLVVTSEIGTVTTLDEMTIALKLNRSLGSSRLYLDDTQVLQLESRHPLETISEPAVVQAVREVAQWADQIEEKLFMIDVR